MGITPLVFSGVSQFSDDFQAITNRMVSIASLPIRALQSDQVELLANKTALSDVRSAVSDFAGSLFELAALGRSKALVASSNSTKVSVEAAGVDLPGTYVISEVESLATSASATSTPGYASASSSEVAGAGNSLQLLVGEALFDIALTDASDNPEGVCAQINSLDAGVSASVIYTGSAYHLTLTADSTGERAIELRTAAGDPQSNLLAVTSPGSPAVFKINGQQAMCDQNVISDLVPGVRITFNATTSGSESAIITVESGKAPLVSALRHFVAMYNALTEKLDRHGDPGGGALAGHGVVNSLRNLLRQIGGYRQDGGVASLSDLGISFDRNGVMSLEDNAIQAFGNERLRSAFQFLAPQTGGLRDLAESLTQYGDPLTGFIRRQIDDYDSTDKRLSGQIASMTERVDRMQATLLAQLQAADSLLARLESQQTMLDASIQSLNVVLYGKKEQ